MAEINESGFTDAPANRGTNYSMSAGDSFIGSFGSDTDEDWVSIELVAGTSYQIDLAGDDDNSDADTILAIYDSAGQLAAFNDDVDLLAGQYNSMLTFTPETSGVYYLSASLFAGNPLHDHTGGYVLSVTDGVQPEMSPETQPALIQTLQGGPGDDVLQGSAADDVIHGAGGNDRLYGLDGRDYLQGDAGDDHLYGGAGADVLLGDAPPPFFVMPDAGAGSDSSGSSGDDAPSMPGADDDSSPDIPATVDPSTADADAGGNDGGGGDSSNGDMLADEPSPTVNLTTADILDFLNGQLVAGDDKLQGGAGDDWLEGGAGDDELEGGAGNDMLIGDTSLSYFLDLPALSPGNGTDGDGVTATPLSMINIEQALLLTIDQLQTGDDKLDGGAGDDILEGGGGADLLLGGTGQDALDGGAGNDRLHGGADADDLLGGEGDDLLHGDAGDDMLIGGAGADLLEGGAGDDHLLGDHLAYHHILEPFIGEPLSEEDAADTDDGEYIAGYDPYEPGLFGSSADGGDDTLDGGAGDDLIDGGGGDDQLTGGLGSDTFVFGPENGMDRVMDFDVNADKIDLSALSGLRAMADLVLRQEGSDLIIDLSAQGGGQVALVDVDSASLDDTHFVFADSMVGDDPMAML